MSLNSVKPYCDQERSNKMSTASNVLTVVGTLLLSHVTSLTSLRGDDG